MDRTLLFYFQSVIRLYNPSSYSLRFGGPIVRSTAIPKPSGYDSLTLQNQRAILTISLGLNLSTDSLQLNLALENGALRLDSLRFWSKMKNGKWSADAQKT